MQSGLTNLLGDGVVHRHQVSDGLVFINVPNLARDDV